MNITHSYVAPPHTDMQTRHAVAPLWDSCVPRLHPLPVRPSPPLAGWVGGGGAFLLCSAIQQLPPSVNLRAASTMPCMYVSRNIIYGRF